MRVARSASSACRTPSHERIHLICSMHTDRSMFLLIQAYITLRLTLEGVKGGENNPLIPHRIKEELGEIPRRLTHQRTRSLPRNDGGMPTIRVSSERTVLRRYRFAISHRIRDYFPNFVVTRGLLISHSDASIA